jgi:lysine/ornithine N-monooxygenase
MEESSHGLTTGNILTRAWRAEEIIRNISQDSQSLLRDLNLEPPEHEGVLIAQPHIS